MHVLSTRRVPVRTASAVRSELDCEAPPRSTVERAGSRRRGIGCSRAALLSRDPIGRALLHKWRLEVALQICVLSQLRSPSMYPAVPHKLVPCVITMPSLGLSLLNNSMSTVKLYITVVLPPPCTPTPPAMCAQPRAFAVARRARGLLYKVQQSGLSNCVITTHIRCIHICGAILGRYHCVPGS